MENVTDCCHPLARKIQVPFHKGLSVTYRIHCVDRFRAFLSSTSFDEILGETLAHVINTQGSRVLQSYLQGGDDVPHILARKLYNHISNANKTNCTQTPGLVDFLALVAFFSFGHPPLDMESVLYGEQVEQMWKHFPDFLLFPPSADSRWKSQVRQYVLIPLQQIPQASLLEWAQQLFLQYSFPFHRLVECAALPRAQLIHRQRLWCWVPQSSETVMMVSTTKHHTLNCFFQMPDIQGVAHWPRLPPHENSLISARICVLDQMSKPRHPNRLYLHLELRVFYQLPVPQKFVGLQYLLRKQLVTRHVLASSWEKIIDFDGALREWQSGLKRIRRQVPVRIVESRTSIQTGKNWFTRLTFPYIRPVVRNKVDPWDIMRRNVDSTTPTLRVSGIKTQLLSFQHLTLQWMRQHETVPQWRWVGAVLGSDHQVLVSPFLHRHKDSVLPQVSRRDIYGGILASDEGTGKTLIVIASAVLYYEHCGQRTLVFTPKTRLSHWRTELCKHVEPAYWQAVVLTDYVVLADIDLQTLTAECSRVVFDHPRLIHEHCSLFRWLCRLPFGCRWAIQAGKTSLRRLIRLIQLDQSVPRMDTSGFLQNGPEAFIVARQLSLRLTATSCLHVPKVRLVIHPIDCGVWRSILSYATIHVNSCMNVKRFNWRKLEQGIWYRDMCLSDLEWLALLPYRPHETNHALLNDYDLIPVLCQTQEPSRCPICLHALTAASLTVFPPCRHEMCHVCVQRWVSTQDVPGKLKCPICQQLIVQWYRPQRIPRMVLQQQQTMQKSHKTFIMKLAYELADKPGRKVLVCGFTKPDRFPADAGALRDAEKASRWCQDHTQHGVFWWTPDFPFGVELAGVTDVLFARLPVDKRSRVCMLHTRLGWPAFRVHYAPFRGSLAHFVLAEQTPERLDRSRLSRSDFEQWLSFAAKSLYRTHG